MRTIGFFGIALRCPSENGCARYGLTRVNSTGNSSAEAGRELLGVGTVDTERGGVGGVGGVTEAWAAANHCVTSSSEGGAVRAYTSVQNLYLH